MSKKALSSLLLNIHVRPNAKNNAIRQVDQIERTIRCDIAADAQNGQANDELIDYFKRILKIPSSHIELIRGHKQRDKVIRILSESSSSSSFDEIFARFNDEISS